MFARRRMRCIARRRESSYGAYAGVPTTRRGAVAVAVRLPVERAVLGMETDLRRPPALLGDRVTFNAHIVETGTDSFRFKKTQEKHRKG